MLPEWVLFLSSFGVSITYLLRFFSTKNATNLTPVLSWMVLSLAYLYYSLSETALQDRVSSIRFILFLVCLSEILRNILLLRYGKRG